MQRIDAQVQAQVRTFFHDLINTLSTLPVNPVTDWLEGGLLLVRKSFFNQTAGVSSTQTANTSQLVTGKIDVIDPDGDDWHIEVVGNPSHGTVVLGTASQTDGIGGVTYTYVPGQGYAGDDQFVVKVTPASATVNILQPEALRERYFTVTVGDAADAVKDHFNGADADPKDVPDTHLYLSNAAATVTVKKQGFLNPKYTATVTLPAGTVAKSFSWMDTRGNMGTIAVDTMLTDDWDAYTKKAAENGGSPLLTFKYSDQGVEKAVFVEVDAVTKNVDGTYTISGDLKDGAPGQEGRVDTWDFVGNRGKAAFDNFLKDADLEGCKSGQECTTVSAVGVLGTTTLSPSAFSETGGHDYALARPGDASALQTGPGSVGPGRIDVGEGNGTEVFGDTGYPGLELTAMIPWGTDGSFIAATNLTQAETDGNGIFLYTAQAPRGGQPTWTKTQLVGNTWNAAVNVMAAYDQVLTDSTGTPVPTTYTGTPVAGASAVKLAVTDNVNPSSLIGQTITGEGIAPSTSITGFISSDITGITYSVSNAITASGPIAVTLPNKPTLQPGLVIGLSDGSVYYWNSNVCNSTTCAGPVIIGAPDGGSQTGNSPVSVAMGPNGQLYAAGTYVSVIDTSTDDVIANIGAPWGGNSFPDVVVSPNGFYAYATSSFSQTQAGIAVIDTAKNAITDVIELPVLASANAVAISPDNTTGYIVNGASVGGVPPSVYQFDTATNTIVSGVNVLLPEGNYDRPGLTFSSDGAYLYVSNAGNGTISVIDTATNTLLPQAISVPGSPGAMALSPDGQYLYVTQQPNFNFNLVSVIDTSTNTVTNAIAVGNGPAGIVFNPNPGLPYAYVTNSNDSTVSVIDTQTMSVIGTFGTGAGGDDTLGAAVTADGINLYLANYDGGGESQGTVPSFQVATPVAQGWAQLQASGGWGNDVAVNNITALPNNLGFVVGLSDGTLATWNNSILADGTIVPTSGANGGCSNGSPGGCWTDVPGNDFTWIDAIVASGQNGGFVAIGYNANWNGGAGWMQGFNGAPFSEGAPFADSYPTTLIPYDGTTLVGSIGSAPVIAENGVISAPSYASLLPDLTASAAGCTSSYNGGNGAGCGGYVLTVQEAAGTPIKVGQTLYGGPGLTSGTVIVQQISDGSGNLCSSECNSGGTGVYLVDKSQVVAPGTPMSASDGTGFIVGFSNGVVAGWNNGLGQLVPEMWGSAETTMIPWRDGFVTGLDNGAIMYWSPSNNPAGGTPFVPDSGPPMALTYAGSTIPSQLAQPPGWSQLEGYTTECGCLGWDQAATSLVQMGDGFAVGLTAPNDSTNGAVQLFTGFGPSSTSSAFGYLQGANTPLQALTPTNGWTEIASNTALVGPNGAVGSIQQMVPINQLIQDSAGNWWNASSVVVGQTDNGINSWAGSNQAPVPTGTAWNQLQTPAAPPGQLDPDTLQSAWNFATATNAPSGSFGTKGAVGGSTDPVFGSPVNQAACGDNCNGDYETFTFNYPFGNDGVIYSLGTTLQANLNLSAAGYGYLFVPAGVWDKFEPDNYSAGLLMALQGGPSVVLNPPDGLSIKDTVTGGTSYTDTQETEVGSFGETVGVDFSLTGAIGLSTAPLAPLTLAYAYYTPGLMFTWNSAGNPDSLGMTTSAFADTGYVSTDDLESYFDPTGNATISATVTPYASVSYGLFTTSPISLDIFKLSVGYQNPITADLTVPIDNFDNTTLTLSSQGFLTASAAFIPGITSDLSWDGKYRLYSVKDQIQP